MTNRSGLFGPITRGVAAALLLLTALPVAVAGCSDTPAGPDLPAALLADPERVAALLATGIDDVRTRILPGLSDQRAAGELQRGLDRFEAAFRARDARRMLTEVEAARRVVRSYRDQADGPELGAISQALDLAAQLLGQNPLPVAHPVAFSPPAR